MRANGYLIITDPERATVEHDTLRCVHCGSIVIVGRRPVAGVVGDPAKPAGDAALDLGGHCVLCHGPTCNRCHAKGTCDPFERKLARVERRDALRRRVTGGA